jgi:hypothetical protein
MAFADTAVNAALDSRQGRRSVVLAAQYGGVRVFSFPVMDVGRVRQAGFNLRD